MVATPIPSSTRKVMKPLQKYCYKHFSLLADVINQHFDNRRCYTLANQTTVTKHTLYVMHN